jgi:hypothetical protein
VQIEEWARIHIHIHIHTHAHRSNTSYTTEEPRWHDQHASFGNVREGCGAGEKDRQWTGTGSLKSESEHDIGVCRATWDLSAPHWAHLPGKWATERAT